MIQRILPLAISLLLSLAIPGRCGSAPTDPPSESPRRLRPFLESGVLAGGETRLSTYRATHFRLYTEGGVELRRDRSSEAPTRSLGLAVFFAPGQEEARFGGGVRITHGIGARWAVQGMAGLLASSEEEERGLFGRGVQLRGSLVHRDVASIGLIWHVLPYDLRESGRTTESGHHHSFYAIGMLHGRPGAVLSAGILGTYLLLGAIFLIGGGAS